MNVIKIDDFNKSMGTLIDLEEPVIYNQYHNENAINIPYNKLMNNYRELLDKNNNYYFICKGGNKSKRVVSILEYYGYHVTQVLY